VAAILFGVSVSTVSKYFSVALEMIVLFGERHAVVLKRFEDLPSATKKKFREEHSISEQPSRAKPRGDAADGGTGVKEYPSYVFVIDGTELKTEIASDRPLRRAMWSEYKHSQT
jgi:hypothetical protein